MRSRSSVYPTRSRPRAAWRHNGFWQSAPKLLEQPRAKGPMRNAPIGFVVAIMNSLAEATMDYVVLDPTNSKKHCEVGFDTPWRVMA